MNQRLMDGLLTALLGAATLLVAPVVLAAEMVGDAIGDPLPKATSTGEPGARWLAELGVVYESGAVTYLPATAEPDSREVLRAG